MATAFEAINMKTRSVFLFLAAAAFLCSPVLGVTLTVTSASDEGSGTLRAVIAAAGAGDTITFDMTQVVSPIILIHGELVIDKALTITGPGAKLLTISGNTQGRVFSIASDVTATIEGLTISDGVAPGSIVNNDGGGIQNYGSLTVRNCTISHNGAGIGGGISGGYLTLVNSTLTGNSSGTGGAIAVGTGALIVNSTLSGNEAGPGGAIRVESWVTLINSTVTGNSAYGSGGGIFSFGSIVLHNSIVAGNTAFSRPDIYTNGSTIQSNGHNFIGDPSGIEGMLVDKTFASTQTTLAQLLAPLADNGGPTATHALVPDSPALNAGLNSDVVDENSQPLATDQRGLSRIVNGVVDIGAFEAPCGVPTVAITAPASSSVYPINTPVTFTGTFDSADGPHTASWTIDGNVQTGTVNEGSGTVSDTFTFAGPGVYSVQLTVANACGHSTTADSLVDQPAMVVIYDPSAGFVTGGGWIASPAGAYAGTSLTGKATFAFVSKYKKGATVPTGETSFQFKVAGLDFASQSYDWLVVSGARAQYKGVGSVNGTSGFGFLLTAIDGQRNGGGGTDRFRIKIWNITTGGMVYDNQMSASDGATPLAIGGGSIVIHQ